METNGQKKELNLFPNKKRNASWVGLLQNNQDAEIFNVSKYSSLNRPLRVGAYCRRFIHNVQCPITDRRFGPLQVRELAAVKKTLIK